MADKFSCTVLCCDVGEPYLALLQHCCSCGSCTDYGGLGRLCKAVRNILVAGLLCSQLLPPY
jgi:hypothetical protein